MSFKTVTCVTIHCDECDTPLQYDDHVPHWDTEKDALRDAEQWDWFVKGGKHYCETHAPACSCDDCDHTPPCGYAACTGCERHAHNAPPPNPDQTSIEGATE